MLRAPSWRFNFPREIASHFVDLAASSEKFMLPEGGLPIDDVEFRALDESIPLKLPFPLIALEFQFTSENRIEAGNVAATKRVVFARERDDSIAISIAFWSPANGLWNLHPEASVPMTGYVQRHAKTPDGFPGLVIATAPAVTELGIEPEEYIDEVRALLGLLNALSCSNVAIDRIPPKRANSAKHPALPFDTYHVLMIRKREACASSDSVFVEDRRSPREHLRRGHIRRLQSGVRLWINATIVNPGAGGKVSKDYAVR